MTTKKNDILHFKAKQTKEELYVQILNSDSGGKNIVLAIQMIRDLNYAIFKEKNETVKLLFG